MAWRRSLGPTSITPGMSTRGQATGSEKAPAAPLLRFSCQRVLSSAGTAGATVRACNCGPVRGWYGSAFSDVNDGQLLMGAPCAEDDGVPALAKIAFEEGLIRAEAREYEGDPTPQPLLCTATEMPLPCAKVPRSAFGTRWSTATRIWPGCTAGGATSCIGAPSPTAKTASSLRHTSTSPSVRTRQRCYLRSNVKRQFHGAETI